jgi:hypothetical protein
MNGNNGSPGEKDDESIRLCCRGLRDPLNEEWQRVSRTMFIPMIEAILEAE